MFASWDWWSFYIGFVIGVGFLGRLHHLGPLMAKIPKQRGSGQTGNTSWGHRSNRINSMSRGGNPHAGGGGGGKKGCAVVGLAGLGITVGIMTLTAVKITQFL